MKRVVCAVHDSAARLYGQPFFAPSTAAAVRSFSDEVNRVAPDNNYHNHSDDFSLVSLGWFDDESGAFSECEVNLIVRGKDVKREV